MTRALSRLAPVLIIVAAGCDTLSARRTAQDGVAAYKKGEFAGALTRFDEALGTDPSLSAVQLNRGFTCLQLFKAGVKDEKDRYGACAIDAFKKYQVSQPEDTRGRDYLLQSFVDTLRYDDALAYFQPELSRTPPSKEAMSLLGQIAAKLGNVDTALEWCVKRAEAAPNDPSAHQCRGVLIWEHLHKHPEIIGEDRIRWSDQGIAALTRTIELSPDQPEPYTFANLLHRERALGHCPLPGATSVLPPPAGSAPPDAGVGVDAGEIDPAVQKACEDARKADLDEAARLQGLALEKIKAAQGVIPGAGTSSKAPGGAPASPAAAPASPAAPVSPSVSPAGQGG